MRCPQCDTVNSEDSQFCKKCATSLTGDGIAQPSFTKTLETPSKGIIPGTTFVARYKVIEELGRGGMGIVYKAEDAKLKRTVAIKLLPPDLTGDKDAKERFIREAQSAAVLDHPNICTIFEVDESEEKTFISMAYVDGQNLRERVKAGPLPIGEGLDLGIQAAEGLTAAHKKGIIHRDIKSANIMVTEQGQVKIMDFGLAKITGASMITREGVTMGTVAYMSPEQAQGKPVDHRSDIWSLGVVLYEMFGGRLPFQGETEASFLYSIVHEDPAPIKEVNPAIPLEIQKVIRRALKKKPEDRFQSAGEMAADLKQYQDRVKAEEAGLFNLRTLLRQLRKPRFVIPAFLVLASITATAVWFFNRQTNIRWVKDTAMPEIQRLKGGSSKDLLQAFELAKKAKKILPEDKDLKELIAVSTGVISVQTEPPGADIYYKEYSAVESDWEYLGVSPLVDAEVPWGFFRFKIEKQGFETVNAAELAAPKWFNMRGLFRKLDKKGTLPEEMVRVTSQVSSSIPKKDDKYETLFKGIEESEDSISSGEGLEDFFLDKYEVNNKKFKEFIDSGGYRDRKFWKHKFIKDGIELTWEEAIAEFVDTTERTSPSTWQAGDFPEGQENYPVGGICWYEAAAYAEWAGKSLPSKDHWSMANYPNAANDMFLYPASILSMSNFAKQGPAAVGTFKGINKFGAYDMAGNVNEWCWNETAVGRCIRGGFWGDAPYTYLNDSQAKSFDRSPNNGFRCVQYLDLERLPKEIFQPLLIQGRDLTKEEPVSDSEFEVFKRQFLYDKTDLNSKREEIDESPAYWTREKITFDAAYIERKERVTLYIYLPKNGTTPFQTVVYFPGSGGLFYDSPDQASHHFQFLLKNGRAVVCPAYKGCYDRKGDLTISMTLPNPSYSFTRYLVWWVKDFKRSIDYLETRPESFDLDKLVYFGFSWGGYLGNIIPAVEERLAVSILKLAGLVPLGLNPNMRAHPEADPINYVTRVKIPTLIVGGKYDMTFPYETTVKPMIDLLGTSEKDMRYFQCQTGHYVFPNDFMRESLKFLEKYLGPVKR